MNPLTSSDNELNDGNPLDPTDDGPTLDEAKAAAAALVHEPQPDAADLPSDVHDGVAGEDDPAIAQEPPTEDNQ